LENQFTRHDLCDDNHERQVEARVQALLETVDNNPWKSQTVLCTEINKFLEIEKCLRDGCHFKWMPQTPSKETIGTLNIFD
jgi:hypothetical protein